MFLKFLILATLSSGIAYYLIALLIGFVIMPLAGVGALLSRGIKVRFLLPIAYLILIVGQFYVWAVWAVYCCKLAQYSAPHSAVWIVYPIAFIGLLIPLRKLTMAERKASGEKTNPWFYAAFLTIAFALVAIRPSLAVQTIGWPANVLIPLAMGGNTIILAVVGIAAWILLSFMFRGTDSPDPAENPLGSALSKHANSSIILSERESASHNNMDKPMLLPRADRLSEALASGQNLNTDEIIDVAENALREAADAMVADGLVASREQVTGTDAAEYLQRYYAVKTAEVENEILDSPEYLTDLMEVGGYYLEAFTREFGSCDYSEWVERMKEDIPIDVSDDFWRRLFAMTKDDFIRRVCVDDSDESH